MKTFHAVSIVPGSNCCPAASAARGKKILSADAPKLPLDDCTMPGQCKCRFQKHADRREGDDDRRLGGRLAGSIWYAGGEKRHARGRRSGDK